MSEQITAAELRGAMFQIEQAGFDGQDPNTLPSVTDKLGDDVPDAWANKADRFSVAAPTIEHLADHMLEGEGVDSRFRTADQIELKGFSYGEALTFAFRDLFITAKDDPGLPAAIHDGADLFDEIANRNSKVEISGDGLKKGADYPSEMAEELYVLAKLMSKHPEASQLDRAARVDIARAALTRTVGRLASMHVDDFRQVSGLSDLEKQGLVSLRQSGRGRWFLDAGGDQSAASIRKKEAVAQEPEALPAGAETAAPDMTNSDVKTAQEAHETPVLVCPAHHRRARGIDTALERLVYAGINFADDLGMFEPDFNLDGMPHKEWPQY